MAPLDGHANVGESSCFVFIEEGLLGSGCPVSLEGCVLSVTKVDAETHLLLHLEWGKDGVGHGGGNEKA